MSAKRLNCRKCGSRNITNYLIPAESVVAWKKQNLSINETVSPDTRQECNDCGNKWWVSEKEGIVYEKS
jgi:hypothetical protein